MKKVLFVATVVRKHINVFHLPFIKFFHDLGYETYVAAGNDTESDKVEIPCCDNYVCIEFKRNPLHPGNLSAYLKLKKLISQNYFDIIHCHTPVGGLLGRFAACKARKNGTKVFYTAHGFHFHKGSSKLNWLIYYPVEKFCSYLTDVLITINMEDYDLAKRKMKAKNIVYVPGVGIDVEKFSNPGVTKSQKRQELGIPENTFVIASVGELNENKSHCDIVKAIAKTQNTSIHYMIAGVGPKEQELKELASQFGMSDRLHLLGYRSDISQLLAASDMFAFPSKREGLPVSLMEAMASAKPCVVSKTRGNTDLIENQKGGYVVDVGDIDTYAQCINNIVSDESLAKEMSDHNKENIKAYSFENIMKTMAKLYLES